jgi:predicted nuclease of predicted toxin-antitoxin system
MLRLAADENFNSRIVRGLRRGLPEIDLVSVQEAGLSGADDPSVLAWAAREGRLLLTHDAATMTRYAYERVRRGESMPGVVEIGFEASAGAVIEDLILLVTTSTPGEWEGQVIYLPL